MFFLKIETYNIDMWCVYLLADLLSPVFVTETIGKKRVASTARASLCMWTHS